MACFHLPEHGAHTLCKWVCTLLIKSNQRHLGTAQGSNNDLEAGKYEYDPTAIAVQDTVVIIDKPEAQTGSTQAANSFNVQYETV